MFRGLIHSVVAALLIGTATQARPEQPVLSSFKVTPDPAVKQGRLPNGLRYAIMQNGTPAKAISVRLIIDVGSYDEADEELGAAHFVEHMAFRSSKGFPDGKLENRFAPLGIAMGRDQNAATGLHSTVYRADMPNAQIDGLRLVLQWMRSAADGILFDPAAVQTERGVVFAEKKSRTTPATITSAAVSRFQAPNLRSANRDPIGTDATLQALGPAQLKAFYERWYRPDNAALVIVGDVDSAALEKEVSDAFASWTAKGAAPARYEASRQFAERGLDAFSRSEPNLPSAIGACRVAPAAEKSANPIERMRAKLLSDFWVKILEQRLELASKDPKAGLLVASPMVRDELRDARTACLISVPLDGQWQTALTTAQAELRRFAADGPTDTELENVIETMRSSIRGGISQAETRQSSKLANDFAEALQASLPILSPRESMRAYNLAVDDLTPEDVRSAYANDWKGWGPLLTAIGPKAPDRDSLMAAWRANESAKALGRYADRKAPVWPYTTFGKTGRVKQREALANGDFTRIHFDNGVILNHKRTAFEAGTASVAVHFGSGQSDFARADIAPAAMAAGFFPYGGLGKMTYEEIQQAVGTSTGEVTLNILPDTLALTARTIADQVPDQLQLLAAYVTDPGFHPEFDAKLPTAADLVVRMLRTQPGSVASRTLEVALFPGDPGLEALATYRVADFKRVLQPLLAKSALEVTVVGDISEAEAIQAVAETFGAFPRRNGTPVGYRPDSFQAFPKSLPPPLTGRHEGPRDKAAAMVIWPLFITNEKRRGEELALELLGQIFDVRLRHRIRVELGKTYSPTVQTRMVDYADQGTLTVNIESTPDDVQAMVAEARKLAASLATGEISEAELRQAREPLIANWREVQRNNAVWAQVLTSSYHKPYMIDDLLSYAAMIGKVTLDDVRKAAAAWINADPAIGVALPTETTATVQ